MQPVAPFTRSDVVAKARELVGRGPDGKPTVRFRHQGRGPAGIDCAGVIIWVGHQLGHQLSFDFTAYERYPSHQQVQKLFDKHLARKPRGLSEAEPGDILLLRDIGIRWPMHMGILADGDGHRNLNIIHSWVAARGVVETPLRLEWTFKGLRVYCYPPILGERWLTR